MVGYSKYYKVQRYTLLTKLLLAHLLACDLQFYTHSSVNK